MMIRYLAPERDNLTKNIPSDAVKLCDIPAPISATDFLHLREKMSQKVFTNRLFYGIIYSINAFWAFIHIFLKEPLLHES